MKNFQNKTNIIRVSKILRSFSRIGLFLWMLAILVFFTSFLIPIYVLPKGAGHLHLDPPLIYWICGKVSCVLFGFIINLKLFKFFDRLKDGHLFDALTIGYLNAAGRWWILFWFIQTFIYSIGRAIIPTIPGLGTWNSGGLFAGLALIFAAWLLKEAQEESELTV